MSTNLEERGAEFLNHLFALLGSIRQCASWERDDRVEFTRHWAQGQLDALIADAERAAAAKAEEDVSERILAAKQQSIDAIMAVFEKSRRP